MGDSRCKYLYQNEPRKKLLEQANELWPDKSDSEIFYACLEKCVNDKLEAENDEPQDETDDENVSTGRQHALYMREMRDKI